MSNHNSEQVDFLRAKIRFLQDSTIVTDSRGHSRVPCFVIVRNGDKYFAKLYEHNRMRDLRVIESKYWELKVPTARIIEMKYLPEIDKTFCIYEYIEGETLAELLPKLSAAEIEQLGQKVGNELKKFLSTAVRSEDFSKELETELANLLENLYLQKEIYESQNTKPLPPIDLARMKRSLQKLQSSMELVIPNFTHTDINLTNIIMRDNEPVIIDTDGSKVWLRAVDFRGNVWWCWNRELSAEDIQKEQAAYRGIYRALFNENIPDSFHQELSFTMMYEFLVRLRKYAGDVEQIYYSFLRWQDNFEQTNYFEDYRFEWF